MNVRTGKIEQVGVISANSAECPEEYWQMHLNLLEQIKQEYFNLVVRCEDFLLYSHKAKEQVYSHFETPQLIGIIKLWCYQNNVPILMRSASTVKNRFTDEILEHLGYIIKTNNIWLPIGNVEKHNLTLHERDAIRHAVACLKFDIGSDEENN